LPKSAETYLIVKSMAVAGTWSAGKRVSSGGRWSGRPANKQSPTDDPLRQWGFYGCCPRPAAASAAVHAGASPVIFQAVAGSGRTADIAIGQALFIFSVSIFNFMVRTGPELEDALADAFFFVGYDIF
jgi:hypothetical protein